MHEIRVQTHIRQVGDAFLVEIPPVAMSLFGLQPGDEITFEPRKIESALDRDPEVRAAIDQVIASSAEASKYLARYDATGEWSPPTQGQAGSPVE